MKPALSQFGERMSQLTGVRAIIKDIIATLKAGADKEFINLSGGNSNANAAFGRISR